MITNDMVGAIGPEVSETVSDRWLMNYAAAVNDTNPTYFDNLDDRRPPAHPGYLSHLEWDALGQLLGDGLDALTPDELVRGVHTFTSTRFHRPIRSRDRLRSRAEVVGAQARRAGGRVTTRIETYDAAHEQVATSYTATTFLGVASEADLPGPDPQLLPHERPLGEPVRTETIEVGALTPYHFSECARDYGIIHTDPAVAAAAGFPGLILHGTATISLALTALVNTEADGDPTAVTGFQAKLTGMVLCPSAITLRVFPPVEAAETATAASVIAFDVLDGDSNPVISDGLILIGATS